MGEVKFKAKIQKQVYKSDNFDVYAVNVDENDYPDIVRNKYGNVSICGALGSLSDNTEYSITAVEQDGKYGISYNVVNIQTEVPLTVEDTKNFLFGILTERQATTLTEVYPNIITLIKDGREDEIDFSKLNGIKEKSFEKIKEKIVSNFCLAELVSFFRNKISLTVVKTIYSNYSSVSKFKEDFFREPYVTLCSLGGIGFKKADAILLGLFEEDNKTFNFGEKDLKSSEKRCVGAVIHILTENESNGNTVMSLVELRNQIKKLVPSCFDKFINAIKNEIFYYDKEALLIAFSHTIAKETYVITKIAKALKENTNKWDIDHAKYHSVNGFELSDEQKKILPLICEYPICILNGYAGVGKTYSTKAIIQMLEENNKSYMLLSPTGKASKVLAENTERKASTIHKALGIGSAFGKIEEIFTDCVIIDEFSMCDLSLFYTVLKTIDFKNTKVLLVGDHAQLPSVGCGNLLHDFITTDFIPKATLTKVFRYGEGGLMTIATNVREQKKYLSAKNKNRFTAFGKNKDYAFIDTENITKNIMSLYKKLISNHKVEDIQVLTSTNKGEYGTVELNKKLQKIVNKNCGNTTNFIAKDNYTFYEGDFVMQIKNNYDIMLCEGSVETSFIANGESGVIKKIYSDEKGAYAIIDFDGVIVRYSSADMNNVSLSYAITIHKSQGSGIKIPILCTPKAHTFMLNSNILYVALTRMKGNNCYQIGNYNTINRAIGIKANVERHTYMPYLIKTVILENRSIN